MLECTSSGAACIGFTSLPCPIRERLEHFSSWHGGSWSAPRKIIQSVDGVLYFIIVDFILSFLSLCFWLESSVRVNCYSLDPFLTLVALAILREKSSTPFLWNPQRYTFNPAQRAFGHILNSQWLPICQRRSRNLWPAGLTYCVVRSEEYPGALYCQSQRQPSLRSYPVSKSDN